MLRRRINGCRCLTDKTADRADIHDIAAWLFAEVWVRMFEGVEHRLHIDRHHAIELGVVILVKLAHIDHTSVVDHDIEPAKGVDSLIDGSLHLLFVRHIAIDPYGPPA